MDQHLQGEGTEKSATERLAEIEFLGWKGFSEKSKEEAKNFLGLANIHPLTSEIKDLSIEFKQKFNIKLGDSIISATAVINNLVLVTRNSKDFNKINDLLIYNPFKETNYE